MFSLLAFLQFNDVSIYWLIPCLLLGLFYAWILYPKTLKGEEKVLSYILFVLRTILVFFLSVLLLSPVLQNQKERLEKPLVIIAQDNSASVKIAQPEGFNRIEFQNNLNQLKNNLNEDYEVAVLNFGDQVLPGFKFDYAAKETDFSQLFEYINTQYGSRNVGALIISSDGIINKGSSPVNDVVKSKIPVYTIALGDTIPKKDILISNISYNNIVYLGNDYPLEISLSAFQFKGEMAQVNVRTNDGQVRTSSYKIDDQSWRKTFRVNLQARTKGVQKIVVTVNPLNGEISKQNNQQVIYVEVLDGREKVLILAHAPHPDLSAIKQSLESNKNYQSDIAYANNPPADLLKYGVIIFHNLPSEIYPIKDILNKISQKPRWFIIGSQTNISSLNQIQNLLNAQTNNTIQDIIPTINKEFSPFALTASTRSFLSQLSPLSVMAGSYTLKSSGSHLLVRRDNISVPMLTFTAQQNLKTAFLTGEGIWRWRLDNFLENENHDAIDELIAKSAQYLSTKDDKRKFRVYPAKDGFTTNQHIILNADLYNDAYEPISDAEISIDVTHSGGNKYSFQFSPKGNFYELDAGIMGAGEYAYIATAQYSNKKYTVKGNFIVKELFAEYQQTVADHQLLYNLANSSNGKMVLPPDLNKIPDYIRENENVKTISYSDKSYEDLIDLKWVFVMMISLLTLEWFLRKRNGLV